MPLTLTTRRLGEQRCASVEMMLHFPPQRRNWNPPALTMRRLSELGWMMAKWAQTNRRAATSSLNLSRRKSKVFCANWALQRRQASRAKGGIYQPDMRREAFVRSRPAVKQSEGAFQQASARGPSSIWERSRDPISGLDTRACGI